MYYIVAVDDLFRIKSVIRFFDNWERAKGFYLGYKQGIFGAVFGVPRNIYLISASKKLLEKPLEDAMLTDYRDAEESPDDNGFGN